METLPAVARVQYLGPVGRDKPLKRMPYEYKLEVISQDFCFPLPREAEKWSDVFIQSTGVNEQSSWIILASSSSQSLEPARTSYLQQETKR